jgi:hypothetical protein
MTTSRERDARLACRWFGWQWYHYNGFVSLEPPGAIAEWNKIDLGGKVVSSPEGIPLRDTDFPHYSTDGNAMLSLLDAVTKDGCRFEINNLGRSPSVICCIELSTTIGDYVEAEADTVCEAVAAAVDKIPEWE